MFGHHAAERLFADALASGRLHHAWLLTGAPGLGKATLAWRLARRLLVPDADPNDARNPVVRRIMAGSHADVLTIEREMDPRTKKLRREVAVDQVREIAGFLHLTPAEGGWRVVVVDGAEDMNRNSANALLKVLEEPPKRAVLLLTSDAPGRLLPTIRSRCRRLPLDALSDDEMDAALRHLVPEHDRNDRTALAAMAGGAPGRAIALAEEGTLALSGLVRSVLAAERIVVTRMHEIADQVAKADASFSTFMELLQSGLGDAVREAARGRVDDLTARRPLAEWGEVWHALGRLQSETERFNLDRRSAVIAGLELLSGR